MHRKCSEASYKKPKQDYKILSPIMFPRTFSFRTIRNRDYCRKRVTTKKNLGNFMTDSKNVVCHKLSLGENEINGH